MSAGIPQGSWPQGSWSKWLLVAAFAGCLNPHPDDEPTYGPGAPLPSGEAPNTGDSVSSEPPLLLPVDDDSGNPGDKTPSSAPLPAAGGSDAGVSSVDGGPGPGDGDAGVP